MNVQFGQTIEALFQLTASGRRGVTGRRAAPRAVSASGHVRERVMRLRRCTAVTNVRTPTLTLKIVTSRHVQVIAISDFHRHKQC